MGGNNIVTYGAGRLWGLDPGSINYGVPLHQEWYRSTVAHNTVSVDSQLQKNADGRLEHWAAEAGATTISASADGAYPGVSLRRTVRLAEGRIEDRFECRSGAEHVYDWAFHAPGRLTCSLPAEPQTGPLGAASGYQHITQVRHARTGEPWWVRWEQDGTQLTLRMDAAPGTEIFTGTGPGRNPSDRVPCVVVRRRGRETEFRAVHRFQ
jgi:hypothetical protein